MHVHGDVYGVDDLVELTATELEPALEPAIRGRYPELGIGWRAPGGPADKGASGCHRGHRQSHGDRSLGS
jgi:hypothetical protein